MGQQRGLPLRAREVWDSAADNGHSTLLVTTDGLVGSELLGIVTARDIGLEPKANDGSRPIRSVRANPRHSPVWPGRKGTIRRQLCRSVLDVLIFRVGKLQIVVSQGMFPHVLPQFARAMRQVMTPYAKMTVAQEPENGTMKFLH